MNRSGAYHVVTEAHCRLLCSLTHHTPLVCGPEGSRLWCLDTGRLSQLLTRHEQIFFSSLLFMHSVDGCVSPPR